MKTDQKKKTYQIDHFEYRKVLRDPNITPSVKALLSNLLEYAGRNNNCFPTEIKLAKDFGLSDRQIRNNLCKLVELGLIKYKQRGYGKSNKYFFAKIIYRKYAKPNSDKLGNTLPVQSGNTLPTNVISKDIQLKYSKTVRLFESVSKNRISEKENTNLLTLCVEYGSSMVDDAINELGNRKLPYLVTGLVERIIEDFTSNIKRRPKPIFKACDKCQNGFIKESEKSITVKECDCHIEYEREKKSMGY